MNGTRQKAEGGRQEIGGRSSLALVEKVPGPRVRKYLVMLDGREVGSVQAAEGFGPYSCRAVLGGVAYLLPSIEGHGETPRGSIADAVRAAREDADALLTWAAEVEAALEAGEVDHG